MRSLIILTAALALTGCVSGYTLVPASQLPVAQGTMKVKPASTWNRVPKGAFDVAGEESWTQNGPLLDGVTFIGALESGKAMSKQKPKDDRQVPVFRENMTPQDLVSMIESYYRIKGGVTVFTAIGVKPANFLGKPGIQFDYDYVGADEVKRHGRSVLAVINKKLYLMALDGAALHYFDAALPDFEAMLASAVIA